MKETIKFSLKPGQCRTIAGRRICNRWQQRTAEASEEYKRGVENPRRSWGKSTCEAQDRYKAGVDKAHSQGFFAKGVMKARTKKWQDKALTKGPGRFAEGVHGAGDAFAEGYKPYHSHFPSIFMPKRFPRGDPRNLERCKAVCTGFGKLKVGKEPTGKIVCPVK